MPVEPVQIESACNENAATFLSRYKVLLLTYEGQKPPSPAFHKNLAAWVKAGGALIVVDDDRDPYNRATEWWNTNGNHFATPRDPLFRTLGLRPGVPGVHPVGKGFVLYTPQSPSALTYSKSGSETVMHLLQTAAAAIHLSLHTANALILRRGPYIIAAGLDKEAQDTSQHVTEDAPPVTWKGDFIDLFDAGLGESHTITLGGHTRALLLDVNYFKSSVPRVLAASAKITNEHATATALTFGADGIAQTQAVARILSDRVPRAVTVGGKPLDRSAYRWNGRTLLLHFESTATPQQIRIDF
jgi:hypothetical protein